LMGHAVALDIAAVLALSALAVSAATVASFRSAAVGELHGKGVQGRLIRKWLTEPIWGSSFWRRSESAPLLSEPRPAKPTI